MTPPTLLSQLDDEKRYALEHIHQLKLFVFVAQQGPNVMALPLEKLEKKVETISESKNPHWETIKIEAAILAHKERADDFARLHGFALVALWSTLEDAVDTLLEIWLAQAPGAMQVEALKKLPTTVGELLSVSDELRPRYVLDLLKEKTRSGRKPGLGQFDPLFEVLGLKCGVGGDTRTALHELQQIRHCMAHGEAAPTIAC